MSGSVRGVVVSGGVVRLRGGRGGEGSLGRGTGSVGVRVGGGVFGDKFEGWCERLRSKGDWRRVSDGVFVTRSSVVLSGAAVEASGTDKRGQYGGSWGCAAVFGKVVVGRRGG